MSEHWRERAELVIGDQFNKYIAEDEDGELRVPERRRPGWWRERFNPRNPAHWLPWLRSRLTGKVAMIETGEGWQD